MFNECCGASPDFDMRRMTYLSDRVQKIDDLRRIICGASAAHCGASSKSLKFLKAAHCGASAVRAPHTPIEGATRAPSPGGGAR
jgi:hypothetical protein